METKHEHNAMTIASYNQAFRAYAAKTPATASSEFTDWMQHAVANAPEHPHTLELGSATGRDAAYLESIGCAVQRTDASVAFVESLRRGGANAVVLNALTDKLGGPWDMVFAAAVFLHFNEDEFAQVLRKTHRALQPKGILAFSVKDGSGEDWEHDKLGLPRYFHYWTPSTLDAALRATGFTRSDIRTTQPYGSTIWHLVIAVRP